MKKVTAIIVALIVATVGFVPAVAYGNEAKQYEERIVEYNLQKSSVASIQEWIDGDLTDDAGAGSEWYIIALSNHGDYDFSNYNKALNNYLVANEIGSASSRLKYALTYIAIGDKTNPYINKALNDSVGEQGIMSLVFGLHLLNNGCKCDDYSVNGLIDELLSLQLADGGFSVMGEYGDVDVTAMTVQALAIHYDNPMVKFAVDNALEFLSARQLENGGYSAYGVANPESSAQVIITLSSLGIDVCNDDRFIKNGKTVFDATDAFLLADGSFCHKSGGASDSTATAQMFCASIAYQNMKNGKSAFYIFDDKTDSDNPATEETVTEITVTDAITVFETTVLSENASKTANATTAEADTQKAEKTLQTETPKTDFARIVIIAVCVASVLICIVLIACKKHKFIVVVIIAAVAAVVLTVKISGDQNAVTIGTVTISIGCETVKDENKSHIPKNGIILDETVVEIEKGDTVYDVLSEICEEKNIIFSSNMGYIEGIANVFELDFGQSSGWVYFVNGEAPSVGCENCELADGDVIEWHYTRDLGKDLDINFEK